MRWATSLPRNVLNPRLRKHLRRNGPPRLVAAMDDYTAEVIASGQDAHASPPRRSHDESGISTPRSGSGGGLRGGFAAIREKAGFQDRLMDRLLQQVIPADDDHGSDAPIVSPEASDSAFAQRPSFNLTTMSYNFRHFNARIGVVFQFQADAVRLFSWARPSHTLSFLAVYSFVCLDPYLLPALPMVLLVLAVLVPAFVARHPAPPKGTLSSEQSIGYSAQGPPLAPAATVRPAKELSKDFFRNMRDLQNSMGDFSHAHDKVVELLVPVTNFSDEALSSTVFLFLCAGAVAMTVASHVIPWRLLFLGGGWALVVSGHPAVKPLLAAQHQQHVQPREERAKTWLDRWIAGDVILDSAPETREVEIFELQRMSDDAWRRPAQHGLGGGGGGEWEPWLFSPSPYDPLSQPRIAGERPRGSRFFEDVLPPHGWEWSEKKWALDLWSRDWVEERIITGVEVETEGERWVYDIYDDGEDTRTGVVEQPEKRSEAGGGGGSSSSKAKGKQHPPPSWEEGEDSSERRGRWRRRRWARKAYPCAGREGPIHSVDNLHLVQNLEYAGAAALGGAGGVHVGGELAGALDEGGNDGARVLAHALVLRVLLGGEVEIVVADLVDEADEVDEGHAVDVCGRLGLHELDAEAEEAARLVAHHLEVVVLGGAREGVAPVEVHALAAVEVDELLGEDGDGARVVQALELLEADVAHVVCRVDGLGHAKDVVGDGEAATQLRRVLNVVDEERRLVEHADDAGDDVEAGRGHVQHGVEGGDELGAETLAGVAEGVVEGGADDRLLLLGPAALGGEVEVVPGVALGAGALVRGGGAGRVRPRPHGVQAGAQAQGGRPPVGAEGLVMRLLAALADPVGLGDGGEDGGRQRCGLGEAGGGGGGGVGSVATALAVLVLRGNGVEAGAVDVLVVQAGARGPGRDRVGRPLPLVPLPLPLPRAPGDELRTEGGGGLDDVGSGLAAAAVARGGEDILDDGDAIIL
ncbi:peroxisomal pex24-like protein [Purpureocillium lavendulum]|uniref:Peroxisomal pex24-like protein n=1 Tax=Purpureocillium lavendulum TaxID=1247861 RepID=A0AB34FNB2_9HYPO|nr:peroxisomal pex24-like protein [Purpureocillium lavendulum]